MKALMVVALFLISTTSSAAPTGLGSPQEARLLTDKIIGLFVDRAFQQGLDLAKSHWPLPEKEIDSLALQIASQWHVVDQRYGAVTGHEFIREEKIGTSFIRYYYLHKFENHALYWQFTFYKPKKSWIINSITYLDELEVLFE